jgi:hypothetical protein
MTETSKPLTDDEYATLLSDDGTVETREDAFVELVDAIGLRPAAEFWYEMSKSVEAGRSLVDEKTLAWILVGAHTHGLDVAEFIAHGCAYAANYLGSSWQLVNNRPGSWEAALISQLLSGTVSDDDEYLSQYQLDEENLT